jgi:hypothetical protein
VLLRNESPLVDKKRGARLFPRMRVGRAKDCPHCPVGLRHYRTLKGQAQITLGVRQRLGTVEGGNLQAVLYGVKTIQIEAKRPGHPTGRQSCRLKHSEVFIVEYLRREHLLITLISLRIEGGFADSTRNDPHPGDFNGVSLLARNVAEGERLEITGSQEQVYRSRANEPGGKASIERPSRPHRVKERNIVRHCGGGFQNNQPPNLHSLQ